MVGTTWRRRGRPLCSTEAGASSHYCPSLQYLLSPETIDALRKPTFDVWLWEPNEVSESLEWAPASGTGREASPSLFSFLFSSF